MRPASNQTKSVTHSTELACYTQACTIMQQMNQTHKGASYITLQIIHAYMWLRLALSIKLGTTKGS